MITPDTLMTLERRYFAVRTSAVQLAIVVAGSSITAALAWAGRMPSVLLAVAATLALVLFAGEIARRIWSFPRWLTRNAGVEIFSFDELVMQVQLDPESRTGIYTAGGRLEARLCDLRTDKRGKRIADACRATNLITAATAVAVLSMGAFNDYNRSRHHHFSVKYSNAIDEIIAHPDPIAPATELGDDPSTDDDGPEGSNGTDDNEVKTTDVLSRKPIPSVDDGPISPWLDPKKTPKAVTDFMEIKANVESLSRLQSELAAWNEQNKGKSQIAAVAIKNAAEGVKRLASALDDINTGDIVPDEIKEAIEKTGKKAEDVIDAAEEALDSPTPENIARLLRELADLLSILEDLLSKLGAWAEEVGAFLDDLLGGDSGFSQKARQLFDEGTFQLQSGRKGAAKGVLERLRGRLEQEMGDISVQVTGAPRQAGNGTPEGGTDAPDGEDDPLDTDLPDRRGQRDSDSGEAETKERLRNRGRGVADYPSSVN